MNAGGRLTVTDAKEMFLNIMRSLDEFDKQTFLAFIAEEWKPSAVAVSIGAQSNVSSNKGSDSLLKMRAIISDIRERVPFTAILPSENIVPPKKGENSDCDPKRTVHVDGFLYDDDDVDELIDKGKIQTNYCADCESKNIRACVIISHSMSVDAMVYIFEYLLPSLNEKTVLDVGSRLGAVLYGAYELSSAKRIIGVEMNADFCKLQREIIRKYDMDDRVEVVNKKIEECPDLVELSDVIVINNAFEFYVPEDVHIEIWKFLKANVRRKTILVTRPHLETTFQDLSVGFTVNEWVKEYDLGFLNREGDPYADIGCYRVC